MQHAAFKHVQTQRHIPFQCISSGLASEHVEKASKELVAWLYHKHIFVLGSQSSVGAPSPAAMTKLSYYGPVPGRIAGHIPPLSKPDDGVRLASRLRTRPSCENAPGTDQIC